MDPRLWGSIQSVKALTLLAQGDADKAAVIPMPREDIGGSALAEYEPRMRLSSLARVRVGLPKRRLAPLENFQGLLNQRFSASSP